MFQCPFFFFFFFEMGFFFFFCFGGFLVFFLRGVFFFLGFFFFFFFSSPLAIVGEPGPGRSSNLRIAKRLGRASGERMVFPAAMTSLMPGSCRCGPEWPPGRPEKWSPSSPSPSLPGIDGIHA